MFVSKARIGVTLVELLVTMSVLAVLVGILLPAIMAARESARRTICQSNLKNLALGVHSCEANFGRFPSNGWGWLWVGDPDQRHGINQPGGWAYQILPFIEQNSIFSTGVGLDGEEKRKILATVAHKSVPVFKCPSRGGIALCPQGSTIQWRNASFSQEGFSRLDYAGNAGDQLTSIYDGPLNIAQGTNVAYSWPSMSKCTGVIFQRSQVKPSEVSDGLSQTYLLGEKYVSKVGYNSIDDPGYDQPFNVGDDWDSVRWSSQSPLNDGDAIRPRPFGSPHKGVFGMAFCDGSIKSISIDIDFDVHSRTGTRADQN